MTILKHKWKNKSSLSGGSGDIFNPREGRDACACAWPWVTMVGWIELWPRDLQAAREICFEQAEVNA